MSFTSQLVQAFEANADPENAFHMEAYMRNKFSFFGIKAPRRRELLKDCIANSNEDLKLNVRDISRELYSLEQRELHLCAMEIAAKFLKKNYLVEDLDFIEFLITTHSWWDTVDFIAKHLLGQYISEYPDMRKPMLDSFTESNDIWLNRSTILFQLGYKAQTDENILFKQCEIFRHSDEFFIQKAIGWALREYGKIQPDSVLNFVNSVQLKPLSKREAIRIIINKS